MTVEEIVAKRDELVARMQAGEAFASVRDGICPVCGREYHGKTSKQLRKTCNDAQCLKVFIQARNMSGVYKGGRPKESLEQRMRRMNRAAQKKRTLYAERRAACAERCQDVDLSPWYVSYDADYNYTPDPGWGW